METRFLQTFLTVVETASLAEAARRLNITPSAVVQRIRALEDEIGQPLIQRSGHSMQPTAAGAAVLNDVRRMLAVEDDVKAAASADLEAGLLRIGVIHTALTGLLPDLLVALRQNRPRIELYVLPGISGDLYSCVADGKLDAAIIVKPHFALSKAFDWTLLRQEPLVLITPLAVVDNDPRRILKREPFIRYDRNHWGGRIVDLHLRKMKIRPREQYELDSLEAITILVSRGLGVSLIPDWLPPWPEGATLRRLKATGAPTRDIGMLWSKSSTRLPLIRAFLTEAINAVRLKELSTTAPGKPGLKGENKAANHIRVGVQQ
jgi:DNA-binding transcriptional LysR family regulator